mgnify:CR=1 FL=1
MESKPFGYLSLNNINIENFCIQAINNYIKTNKTNDEIATHELLGKISYKYENDRLLINFQGINSTISIFKSPISIIDAKSNSEKLKIFDEASLKVIFNTFSNNYNF